MATDQRRWVRVIPPTPAVPAGPPPLPPPLRTARAPLAKDAAAKPIPVRPLRRIRTTQLQLAAFSLDFLGELASLGREVRHAMDTGDAVALRFVVHRLRGSGGMLGYPEVTARAAVVNDLLRQGACLAACRTAVDALLRVIDEAPSAEVPPLEPE